MNNMKKQETTLVQRACAKVKGFKRLHKQLEKKIIVRGKSLSTLNNYMRCIAHVALHFNRLPSQLDIEQNRRVSAHGQEKKYDFIGVVF